MVGLQIATVALYKTPMNYPSDASNFLQSCNHALDNCDCACRSFLPLLTNGMIAYLFFNNVVPTRAGLNYMDPWDAFLTFGKEARLNISLFSIFTSLIKERVATTCNRTGEGVLYVVLFIENVVL